MTENKLYGLVLSGGKSTRMGSDKGVIKYHGVPQREYLYKILNEVCDKTFMSIRSEQHDDIPNEIEVIKDTDKYRGPYNGILSAHEKYPDASWLVLACDLPLMDEKSLKQLISNRNSAKTATAFATKESGLPEPLAAIWEANGLQASIKHLNNGTSTCPRKFLINTDIKIVYPDNEDVLINANSKEDYQDAISKINKI